MPTEEGWRPLLRARTARWFMWRIHGLFGEEVSRFAYWVRTQQETAQSNTETPTDVEGPMT